MSLHEIQKRMGRGRGQRIASLLELQQNSMSSVPTPVVDDPEGAVGRGGSPSPPPQPQPLFSKEVLAELHLIDRHVLAKEIAQATQADQTWKQNYILVNFSAYGPGLGEESGRRRVFVPGEVTLTAFTFESGLIEQHHTFIDPGPANCTQGHIYDTPEYTPTERWLKGLCRQGFSVQLQDVDLILTRVETFVGKYTNSSGELPKLLCFENNYDVVLGCFEWMYFWRKRDDKGASYNAVIENVPVIWFLGQVAYSALQKITKDLHDEQLLKFRESFTSTTSRAYINFVGYRDGGFFELLPNDERVTSQVDVGLNRRIGKSRGFCGTIFRQRRSFFSAEHADDYFRSGMTTMELSNKLCCEMHGCSVAPSNRYCTKALGAKIVLDLMDCIKYVKEHYV